jgi:hypothetical protein
MYLPLPWLQSELRVMWILLIKWYYWKMFCCCYELCIICEQLQRTCHNELQNYFSKELILLHFQRWIQIHCLWLSWKISLAISTSKCYWANYFTTFFFHVDCYYYLIIMVVFVSITQLIKILHVICRDGVRTSVLPLIQFKKMGLGFRTSMLSFIHLKKINF